MPDCHNLYKNSFTYHSLQRDRPLDFDEANQYLGIICLLFQHFVVELSVHLVVNYSFFPCGVVPVKSMLLPD